MSWEAKVSVVFVNDVESAKEISPVLRSRSRPCFNGAGTNCSHFIFFKLNCTLCTECDDEAVWWGEGKEWMPCN